MIQYNHFIGAYVGPDEKGDILLLREFHICEKLTPFPTTNEAAPCLPFFRHCIVHLTLRPFAICRPMNSHMNSAGNAGRSQRSSDGGDNEITSALPITLLNTSRPELFREGALPSTSRINPSLYHTSQPHGGGHIILGKRPACAEEDQCTDTRRYDCLHTR